MRVLRSLIVILILFSSALHAQTVLDKTIAPFSCSDDLISCLTHLERHYQVRFSYKQSDLEGLNSELVISSASSLGLVLKKMLAPHRLDFSVYDDNKIAITKRLTLAVPLLGLVLDYTNGEVIQQAQVHVEGSEKEYFTDQFGLFRMQALSDTFEITIIKEGYQLLTAQIILGNYTYMVFKMTPMVQFTAVDVKPDSAISLSSKSYEEIDPNSKRIPGFGGEADALNNMRLKSGIQNIGLGDPGLIVRGGGPDQNFIMIDGIPVYNTFHILGLYSIFNSSTINSIKLYKDAFPSKYGSRLSSVVDVSLYNGNKKKLSGDADVGIISSGFSLNGPIVKEKLSFSLAARRTYADLLTYPVQNFLNKNDAQENTTGLWYYDVFAKIHYQINKKSQLKITAYNGGDELNFSSKLRLKDSLSTLETSSGNLQWRNKLLGGQFHHVFNSSFFMTVQSAYSNYFMEFRDAYAIQQLQAVQSNEVSYSSGLSELRNTIDFDHFNGGQNHVLFGGGLVYYQFEPFSQAYHSIGALSTTDTVINSSEQRSSELYGYIEDNIYLKSGLLSVGMRLSRFQTGSRKYVSIQPRLFLTKNLNRRVQLRFSITDMSQFLHLLPNNNLGLPIDIWLPVTDRIEPLRSFQISTALKVKWKKAQAGGSVFAKNYRNLLEHKNGSNFWADKDNWTDQVEIGRGTSAGFELQGTTKFKKWDITGSYTYCRSTRNFTGINNGGTFYSKYDRPNSINIYGEYAFNKQTSFSVSFTYASGNPITIPSSRYITVVGGREVIVEEYNEVNNFRLPATHHLDVALKHSRTYKNFNSDLVVGIYNLYNQLNPFMVYIGVDQKVQPVLKVRSYLPMMPMLKYHITF